MSARCSLNHKVLVAVQSEVDHYQVSYVAQLSGSSLVGRYSIESWLKGKTCLLDRFWTYW